MDNLAQALPERPALERQAIARAAYRNMALVALEGLAAGGFDAAAASQAIVEQWGGLWEAIAARKGVLVASAHFGSWELFVDVVAKKGAPVSAVVRRLKGGFNQALMEGRLRSGIELLPERNAVQHMLRALKAGRTVTQLVDQSVPARSAVFVPFFGRLTATSPSLSLAAQRSKAPVFLALTVRVGAKLEMIVEGPLPVPDTGDREGDLIAHVALLSATLEKHLRRFPEQWLWLHRRWKTPVPPGLMGPGRAPR